MLPRFFDVRCTLGDLNGSTLLEIWNGVNMVKLRESHTSSLESVSPCQPRELGRHMKSLGFRRAVFPPREADP